MGDNGLSPAAEACIRKHAALACSILPLILWLVVCSGKTSSAFVVLDKRGSWRQTRLQSAVSTMSHSMKSAPCTAEKISTDAGCGTAARPAGGIMTTLQEEACLVDGQPVAL